MMIIYLIIDRVCLNHLINSRVFYLPFWTGLFVLDTYNVGINVDRNSKRASISYYFSTYPLDKGRVLKLAQKLL